VKSHHIEHKQMQSVHQPHMCFTAACIRCAASLKSRGVDETMTANVIA